MFINFILVFILQGWNIAHSAISGSYIFKLIIYVLPSKQENTFHTDKKKLREFKCVGKQVEW